MLGATLAEKMPLGTALAILSFGLTGVVIILMAINAPLRVQRLIKPQHVWPTDSTENMPELAPATH